MIIVVYLNLQKNMTKTSHETNNKAHTHMHHECIHLCTMKHRTKLNLTKLKNLLEIRFENFMLDPQQVLHGQTCSLLKTPDPKSTKYCSPKSRHPFNLRQSPDQWELRLEMPPIGPRLGQEKKRFPMA